MIEPNNLRNRWRRMRDAHEAYGWTRIPFRKWLNYADAESYRAEPHHLNFKVTLRGADK